MPLNSEQQQAALIHRGPAMILAGPGSGKTSVITHRVRQLIETYKADPSGILVITFTRAAADEMKGRFHELTENRYAAVTFGTFHAVFFKILKYAYGYTGRDIISPQKQWEVIREILYASGGEIEDENEFIPALLSEFGLVKGNRMDLAHYHSGLCAADLFRELFQKYHERLRRERLLDFDDMLRLCMELFTERADILSAWQRKYEYILIDEFQDINLLQYQIMQLLARPQNNLFIVGDDDQSIYRFRGARPEIMLGFRKDYPDAAVINLKDCYRCSPEIVTAAGALIAHNKARYKKELRAAKESCGRKVIVRAFPEEGVQNRMVLRELAAWRSRGVKPEQIALLYRTTYHAQQMVGELIRAGIPFSMRDVVPNMFEHRIAKDLIAYLSIAAGSRERADFMMIINKPKRYIHRGAFTNAKVSLGDLRAYYADKEWMQERIDRLEYDIRMLGKMKPFAAINYIRKGMGYENYLAEYAQYRQLRLEDLLEILDSLQESSASCETINDWFSYIRTYSEALREQKKAGTRTGGENPEGVVVSTMHGAKGLEYRIVFLCDVNEGIVPHHKASMTEDVEEERRLFYVAMTRASEQLYIYYPESRHGRACEPSRYLREIIGSRKDQGKMRHPQPACKGAAKDCRCRR